MKRYYFYTGYDPYTGYREFGYAEDIDCVPAWVSKIMSVDTINPELWLQTNQTFFFNPY